ncbi:class I SAM-dependent methyltransferase [Paraburkholderia sprentiae WSM5005]|uniref:Class I SAM-dependent methyltransferase n=1 Tax=Paraburkholderia sprentiae WSM5005 TaxID=754502 RepID=A0A1I9YIW4_9BURK|nr:class I SAM-dependent methyltransferase [Paraburkholderia sprentiae]APA86247.1 class I SAM-dependent methyltransferase [Paraburkholderia sprentiae WSM5005]
MRQKAIVSLLWGTQFDALRRFLEMHEPMVVILSADLTEPLMRTGIEATGSTVVYLEDMFDPSRDTRFAVETALMQAQFVQYLNTRCNEAREPGGALAPTSTVIAGTLAADLHETAALLDRLNEAASRYDIALFVTSEDATGDGKVATTWAKSRDIPTLHVAHGLALADPYTVHDDIVADKLAVFGRRGMEGYLDLGYPEDRFVITGNPGWDSYAQFRNRKGDCRRALDEKYGFKPGLPLLVFGTTWSANFSAHCNEDIYADSLMVFVASCEALRASGLQFNGVIKDRPANRTDGERRCAKVLSELGAAARDYHYCTDDTQLFAAGADLLVAVDSNYLIEGMLARTPVINLLNATGIVMGPSFEAESGILEVEAADLAGIMHRMLTDQAARREVIEIMGHRAAHYNAAEDGSAAARVAELMATMAISLPRRVKRYVWQQYLDAESAPLSGTYHANGRSDLAQMFTNTPSVILDIGCAAGNNAALVKERFPGSRAWGIEMNRHAAELARQKLDNVLVGRFEDFDLAHEGLAPGTLDAVLLADVLEHMYNPWGVMVKLREYMSPSGQLVLSIPNTRHLGLMDGLSKGNWTYAEAGLLDVTHIRFFTRKEMIRFCEETGYRVIQTRNSLDGGLLKFWQQHQDMTAPINIELDRMTLKNVTRDELLELCTIQFYLLLEKA